MHCGASRLTQALGTMLIAFMIFGAVWFALSVRAWRLNKTLAASLPTASPWRKAYRFWWLLGLLLGVASYFIAFPVTTSERYVVHGFPFPAYAFDAAGHDYVGLLTLPFMLANFVCWFLAAHFCFWLASRRAAPRIGA